jgi:MFS family permease
MVANERYQLYPLWVRLAVRKGTKRSVALGIVWSSVMLVGCALLSVLSELQNLGWLALTVGMAGAALGAVGVVWSWLALRWVDHNGGWPHQPD